MPLFSIARISPCFLILVILAKLKALVVQSVKNGRSLCQGKLLVAKLRESRGPGQRLCFVVNERLWACPAHAGSCYILIIAVPADKLCYKSCATVSALLCPVHRTRPCNFLALAAKKKAVNPAPCRLLAGNFLNRLDPRLRCDVIRRYQPSNKDEPACF